MECGCRKKASLQYCIWDFLKTIIKMTLVSTLSINRDSIAWKGKELVIKEYFEKEVASKPNKYQTKPFLLSSYLLTYSAAKTLESIVEASLQLIT